MLMNEEAGQTLKGLANQGKEFGFYSSCSRKSLDNFNGVWQYNLTFIKSILVCVENGLQGGKG